MRFDGWIIVYKRFCEVCLLVGFVFCIICQLFREFSFFFQRCLYVFFLACVYYVFVVCLVYRKMKDIGFFGFRVIGLWNRCFIIVLNRQVIYQKSVNGLFIQDIYIEIFLWFSFGVRYVDLQSKCFLFLGKFWLGCRIRKYIRVSGRMELVTELLGGSVQVSGEQDLRLVLWDVVFSFSFLQRVSEGQFLENVGFS